MTENEKLIVSLLSRYGPLTKRSIAARGNIGWATTVKMTTRLIDAGIVTESGTEKKPGVGGKQAVLYDLTDDRILAIGLDVRYGDTSLVIMNLKNKILRHDIYPTPQGTNKIGLRNFLVDIIRKTETPSKKDRKSLAGIGIGLPLWLVKHEGDILDFIQREISSHFEMKVVVSNNVRSYAMYKRWIDSEAVLKDFVLVTIRSGIGVSIFHNGTLYRGEHGLAGELSHNIMVENGKDCRCGKKGCLETLVNQDLLFEQYLKFFGKYRNRGTIGLPDLFRLARNGQPKALQILRDAAHYLGKTLATLLLVLDTPEIIIAAEFGEDGDAIIPFIRNEINGRIIPGIDFSLAYDQLDPLGFAQGSAMLVLKDFLAES